jgi:aryl-alcohol dehydrogenase-like predicted oxidoreductase
MVNAIGYGAMHLSIDRSQRPSEQESIALIGRAVDELGIDFIDTADAYCADDSETGHNERLINEALKGRNRDGIIVATKGGSTRPGGRWERDGRPAHLKLAVERSVRALGVERIDLYQLHAVDPRVPIEDSIGAIADMQRLGMIHHIGVSNVTVEQIERARTEAEIVSVQNQFSAIDQDGEAEVIEYCEKNGLTYLPWNPVGGRGRAAKLDQQSDPLNELAQAHKTTPHVVALAWLLHRSPSIIPIPGTRRFDHLKQNLEAMELKLAPDELAMLGGKDEG